MFVCLKVCAFIHTFVENKLTADTETETELQCSEICPCRTLQNRARADRCTVIILIIITFIIIIIIIMIALLSSIVIHNNGFIFIINYHIRYIFSLASNPFYLWLICTIFYEVCSALKIMGAILYCLQAGEGYVPRTLTQLYTWVMLVFSNQWRHTETERLNLDNETISFLRG